MTDAGAAGPCDLETLSRVAARTALPAEVDAVRDHLDGCAGCSAALLALVQRTDDRQTPRSPGGHLPARTTIGRFVILDVLGSGNMGTVFRARDPELDRAVAIKVLGVGRVDERHADRLLREARAMAQVRHPNVVTVYEVGRDADVVFVAMEQIRGPTLRAALAERPSRATVLDWLAQVARGIAAIHAAGLVHRDLKPDNVFVEARARVPGDAPGEHRVVVGDFGLAMPSAVDAVDGAPTATLAAGTPAYMSPEQLQGRPADHRADVFAFGITAWEALTGRRPFDSRDAASLEAAIRAGPPPRDLLGVTPALARTLRCCLAVAPADRPRSIDEVVAALRDASTASSSRGNARTRVRAGAAIVGVGAVVTGLLVMRGREPSAPADARIEIAAAARPDGRARLDDTAAPRGDGGARGIATVDAPPAPHRGSPPPRIAALEHAARDAADAPAPPRPDGSSPPGDSARGAVDDTAAGTTGIEDASTSTTDTKRSPLLELEASVAGDCADSFHDGGNHAVLLDAGGTLRISSYQPTSVLGLRLQTASGTIALSTAERVARYDIVFVATPQRTWENLDRRKAAVDPVRGAIEIRTYRPHDGIVDLTFEHVVLTDGRGSLCTINGRVHTFRLGTGR